MNCTDKFLKHSERVGARFAEQNAGTSVPRHELHSINTYVFLPADMMASGGK